MGIHSFDCPNCKKYGFIGFWQNLKKYPSPMDWSCSFCGTKVKLERTPYEVEVCKYDYYL